MVVHKHQFNNPLSKLIHLVNLYVEAFHNPYIETFFPPTTFGSSLFLLSTESLANQPAVLSKIMVHCSKYNNTSVLLTADSKA